MKDSKPPISKILLAAVGIQQMCLVPVQDEGHRVDAEVPPLQIRIQRCSPHLWQRPRARVVLTTTRRDVDDHALDGTPARGPEARVSARDSSRSPGQRPSQIDGIPFESREIQLKRPPIKLLLMK